MKKVLNVISKITIFIMIVAISLGVFPVAAHAQTLSADGSSVQMETYSQHLAAADKKAVNTRQPSITIVEKTYTSVTLYLVFPVCGSLGNVLGYIDFNRGQLVINSIYGYNVSRNNGLVTVNGLLPGGLYQFALMWSTDGGVTFGFNNSVLRRVVLPHETAEQLVRNTSDSDRIATYIEYNDIELVSASDFDAWINDLDRVYQALENLTGAPSYSPMNIVSRRDSLFASQLPDGRAYWFEWMGWAGNPIYIYRPFFRNIMMRLSDNDWGEVIIHEMGHNFSNSRWEFDEEFFAYFFTFYVADTVPGVVLHRDDMVQWFTGREYADLFRYHHSWGYYAPNGGFRADNDFNFAFGLTHIFVEIQSQIGWEPFRQTFRYFNALPEYDVPTTNADKFNMFVLKLSDYSGEDVISMMNYSDFNIIRQRFGDTITRPVVESIVEPAIELVVEPLLAPQSANTYGPPV